MNHDWLRISVGVATLLSIANAIALFYPHKSHSPLENSTISSIAHKVESKSKEYYDSLAKTSQDAADKLKSEFYQYRKDTKDALHNMKIEAKKQSELFEARLRDLEKRNR